MSNLKLRLKKLDSVNKTIQVWFKSGIVGLDGKNKAIQDVIPVEEIKYQDILVFRVKAEYCTADKLQDICESVGELKRRGLLKQSAFVVPDWIELCELCPESSSEQDKA
jgi:hypothetical protein